MSRTACLASTIALLAGLAPPAAAQTGVPSDSTTPAFLIGHDQGGLPQFQLIGLLLPAVQKRGEFAHAYPASFMGGVRVASGDVDGDGTADIITGAGPGAAPHVKVFDGRTGTEIRSFFAFPAAFQGGVSVAAGDVNGDGVEDIVTGVGPGGGPIVKVFDGATGAEIRSFFAYDDNFQGGVNVATGDVTGDGVEDIITGAGPGAAPHVKVFDGLTGAELSSFFAYPPSFTGGVHVAAGDLDGDGRDELITGAGPGGGPHVKVFDGASGTERASFFAYESPDFSGSVRVATSDMNRDGIADIIVGAGPGLLRAGTPHVKVFDGRTYNLLDTFPVYAPNQNLGVFVSGHSVRAPLPPTCVGDADQNGAVTFDDITSVLGNFGTTCPAPR